MLRGAVALAVVLAASPHVAGLHHSAAAVALRWVVQQGIPAITSSNVAAYTRDDLDVFAFNLTETEMAQLSHVA